MNEYLEEQLFLGHPRIYHRNFGGFECNDGWYKLLDILAEFLEFQINNNNWLTIEVQQIKEKFGTLRFYYSGGTPEIEGAVWFAEFLSGFICEKCGSMDNSVKTQNIHCWLQTLCNECWFKQYSKETTNE